IQRSYRSQLSQFIFAQLRHTVVQIVDSQKLTRGSLAHNRLARLLAQTFDVSQTKPDHECRVLLFLDRAQPVRTRDIDRQDFEPMSLRVFDERERLIKTHRLVIENRGRERRQVITLQIRTRISNQREAGRMRLRKTVKRKRTDREDNLILFLSSDPVSAQAL